jgi:phosphoribosyl-AMP cyclohydrolase
MLMATPDTPLFKARGTTTEIEQGSEFTPKFDRDGLIGAIVTDAASGNVLMFAHMNAEALAQTIATRYAHFWSRSRAKLWKKGEESGNLLRVVEMRTDCDQDVLWLICTTEGEGVACHTSAKSCFYRRFTGGGTHVTLENAALPRPVTR